MSPSPPTTCLRRHTLAMFRFLVLAGVVLGLAACGAAPGGVHRTEDRSPGQGRLLALFPVENLSARPAPLESIRGLLADRLQGSGFRVLDDTALDRAFARHRIRYTGGVTQAFAGALRQEDGVQGIIIPSLEIYDETVPPRIALFARLVSTEENPTIRWVDSIGAAGDDAPGILGLGLIDDPHILLKRAVSYLVASLSRHAADAWTRTASEPAARKFNPRIVYRADALDPAREHSVAVVPFFNKTERKHAGEIIALHMIRSLMAQPALQLVEPGVVREELLRFRIIMTDGISLPQTETILGAVSADLVLNGEVLSYEERSSQTGAPAVDFGLLFIERRTARVVYSSYSHNVGDDGVFFFDVGRVNTAHAMAARMARAVAARMVAGPPTPRARQDVAGPQDRRR